MKLAMIIAAGSLATIVASATPVFACPGHDSETKTTEKAPEKDTKTADKSKEAPKATETKDTAKAAPAPSKDTAKKPADKVSQK